MPPELSDLEAKFFETGELPDGLKTQEPAAELTAVPEILTTPAAAPAPIVNQESQGFQALREALAAEQGRRVELENSLKEIAKQFDKSQQIPEPNPQEDPIGAMMYKMQKMQEEMTGLRTQLNNEQQSVQMNKQFTDFRDSVMNIRNEFAKTHTDFDQAYQHMRGVRMQDLRDMGVPEAKAAEALLQEEINITQAALRAGKNPAEQMYTMAKRYGFAAKPATAAKAESDLEKIAKGIDAAKSPQKGGTEGILTMESLKSGDASKADWDKIVQDDDMWAKLVGGKSGKGIF